MGLITKGMGAIIKKLGTASRNKASKKLFKDASGLQHPVIKSFKPKKNLKKRREDFEDITKAVDDSRKRFNMPKTAASDKIKYDAIKKVSKIHDKYDKIKAGKK